MFSTKTLFVLGAGASAPYGFSTGWQLLDQVRNFAPEKLARIAHYKGPPADFAGLAYALKHCQTYSIDALLERRSDLLDLGKRLIAALLIQEECRSHTQAVEKDGDWIRWLFDQMMLGVDEPLNFASSNNVSFVTYNYDRLLEYRIWHSLQATYNMRWDHAATVMRKIPIVHLHGVIAPLRLYDFDNHAAAAYFGCQIEQGAISDSGYSPEIELARTLDAAKSFVKIIHEGKTTSEEYERARRLMTSADQIVFMGFGFGATNTQRLGLQGIATGAARHISVHNKTNAELNFQVLQSFHSTARPTIQYAVNTPLERFLRERMEIAQ